MTMGKDWIRLAAALVWAFLLLFPMLGAQLGFESFSFEWGRLARVMGLLAVGGVLVVVQRGVFARRAGRGVGAVPRRALADRIPPRVGWTVLAAVALAFPWFADNYARDVAINVLIYVTLGLGLNVVVGLAGLLDLGYIAFYAVGAYTYALLNTHFGIPFWVALPAGCLISAVAGAVIGYPTLKMRGDYLAIVTLGFGEIIRLVLNNWDRVTEGPNGILGIKAPGLYYPALVDGRLSLEHIYLKNLVWLYFIVLAIAALTVIGVSRLDRSRIGRAWVSIREDETAAELTGIPTVRMKLYAYMLGAVFAGLAGAFFAAKVRYINPSSFVFLESALVLCIVVLGGMGSIPGIILGAAAIIVLPELFRDLELYRMLAFGGAMTLMMIFRPEGLVPAHRRRLELHAEQAFAEQEPSDA
ncbi:MAG: high-affinity branched-chain amino acid ABC transporter permease LivM [Deferrisomatales bacterium]